MTLPHNRGYAAASAARLPVTRAWLYRPEREWLYSHHPHLAWCGGRYHAMWSNGRRDEDSPGQRVLHATSGDFQNWTQPVPLLDSRRGRYGEAVLTAAGFHTHAGGLVAYVGCYEYLPEVLDGVRRRDAGDKGHRGTALLAHGGHLPTRDGRDGGG